MEEILTLVRLVKSRRHFKTEFLTSSVDINPTKIKQLYDLLLDNSGLTEDELEILIYGEGQNRNKFNKLKSKLKSKLISKFLIASSNSMFKLEIEKAYYNCIVKYTLSQLLILNNCSIISLNLLNKIIPISKQFEFTEILYMAYKSILEIKLNKIDVNYIIKEFTYYKNLYLIESELELLYTEMASYLDKRKSVDYHKVKEKWYSYYDIAISYLDDYKTHQTIRYGYRIILYNLILDKKYDLALKHCENALKLINSKPYKTIKIKFALIHLKTIILINTGDYKQAQSITLTYIDVLPQRYLGWFAISLYCIIASIYNYDYKCAYNVYYIVKESDSFKTLYESKKQNFLVHEAYIHFLIAIGKINPAETQYPNPPKFRLYKFLNEIPIYEKDKRGLNVAILIVHILFLLHKKQYDKIIDRTDSLKQYSYRYLRKDDTFRANCFIKMLVQLPRAGFKRDLTIRYTARYREKLSTVPINVTEQGIENEIIPYEHLWDIILDLLEA